MITSHRGIMYMLRISVSVAPTKRYEFEHAVHDLLNATSNYCGRKSRAMSRDVLDQNLFWYHENWESQEAMTAYFEEVGFRQLLGAMKVLGEIRVAEIITSQEVRNFELAERT